jgi:hypothetical protein
MLHLMSQLILPADTRAVVTVDVTSAITTAADVTADTIAHATANTTVDAIAASDIIINTATIVDITADVTWLQQMCCS